MAINEIIQEGPFEPKEETGFHESLAEELKRFYFKSGTPSRHDAMDFVMKIDEYLFHTRSLLLNINNGLDADVVLENALTVARYVVDDADKPGKTIS